MKKVKIFLLKRRMKKAVKNVIRFPANVRRFARVFFCTHRSTCYQMVIDEWTIRVCRKCGRAYMSAGSQPIKMDGIGE